MKTEKHCKGCVYCHIRYGGGIKPDREWCGNHSTFTKKAKSICILQGSKKSKSQFSELIANILS